MIAPLDLPDFYDYQKPFCTEASLGLLGKKNWRNQSLLISSVDYHWWNQSWLILSWLMLSVVRVTKSVVDRLTKSVTTNPRDSHGFTMCYSHGKKYLGGANWPGSLRPDWSQSFPTWHSMVTVIPQDRIWNTMGYHGKLSKDGSWNSTISAHINRQISVNIGMCPYCFICEEGSQRNYKQN